MHSRSQAGRCTCEPSPQISVDTRQQATHHVTNESTFGHTSMLRELLSQRVGSRTDASPHQRACHAANRLVQAQKSKMASAKKQSRSEGCLGSVGSLSSCPRESTSIGAAVMKNIASCQKLVNKLCAHSRMTCQRISQHAQPHAQPHALRVSRTCNTHIFFTSRKRAAHVASEAHCKKYALNH